jgi:hypothetical protein
MALLLERQKLREEYQRWVAERDRVQEELSRAVAEVDRFWEKRRVRLGCRDICERREEERRIEAVLWQWHFLVKVALVPPQHYEQCALPFF